MQEITIQLSDMMKEFVDGRIASGDYPSPAEFINHLLKEEQQRRAREYLKMKIRDAEASGESEEITPAYWDEVRKVFCGLPYRGYAGSPGDSQQTFAHL